MKIATEAEYVSALLRIIQLTLANPLTGSPEAEELDALSADVRTYDDKHHPFDPDRPTEAGADTEACCDAAAVG